MRQVKKLAKLKIIVFGCTYVVIKMFKSKRMVNKIQHGGYLWKVR